MVDLKLALANHSNLPAVDMLAIVSQLLGNMVAMQDCHVYNAAQIMDLVGRNIEIGNSVAIMAMPVAGSA
jgi:hypothetical protein